MRDIMIISLFLSKIIYCSLSSGSHIVHESPSQYGSGQGGSAVNHNLGDTGIKAMVITEDVLHKGDGKAYTSIPALSSALQSGTAKSVDQQIAEMKIGALQSAQESLNAQHDAAKLKQKIKNLDAQKKSLQANLLAKKQADINKIIHSPREELVKDIMPIIAVTPHSLGFLEHDKLELKRLNDLREATLNEGEMQKRNALLHERPNNTSPMDSLISNPSLIKKFYENAPVNKTSAVVDPTKGKFSIINDNTRHSALQNDLHNRNTPSSRSSNKNTAVSSGDNNLKSLDNIEIPPSTKEGGIFGGLSPFSYGSNFRSWF